MRLLPNLRSSLHVFCAFAVASLGSCASNLLSSDGGAGDLAPGDGAAGDAANGCAGYLDVVADNGAPHRYAAICQGSFGSNQSMTAVGYRFEGGPFPGVKAIDVAGCLNAKASSEGVVLSARDATGPGTFMKGSASYTDAGGASWGVPGDSVSIVLSRVDPVGGVIEGSFTATVTHGGNAAHSLSGAFHVCRVSDALTP